MAEHDPKTPDRGPVPDPHANKPAPPRDAHTRPGPEGDAIRPDQDEDLGPVPELFGAAGTEAATVVSDDPDLAASAIEQGAEAEGMESAQILGLLVATIVVLIVIVFAIFYLARMAGEGRETARHTDLRYPERQELQTRSTDLITNYAVGEEGTYRIPLSRAQELVARDYGAAPGAFESPDSRVGFNLAFPRSHPGRYHIEGGGEAGQQTAEPAAGLPATETGPSFRNGDPGADQIEEIEGSEPIPSIRENN